MTDIDIRKEYDDLQTRCVNFITGGTECLNRHEYFDSSCEFCVAQQKHLTKYRWEYFWFLGKLDPECRKGWPKTFDEWWEVVGLKLSSRKMFENWGPPPPLRK